MATAVQNRINRHRSTRSSIRPIMKRNSHSEKAASFELDRNWEDHIHYENHGWGASTARAQQEAAEQAANLRETGYANSYESTYDIYRPPYRASTYQSHGRSTSYSGSGAGFVHPFQQTPRSAHPPAFPGQGHEKSRSFDDYSPVIGETENSNYYFSGPSYRTSTSSARHSSDYKSTYHGSRKPFPIITSHTNILSSSLDGHAPLSPLKKIAACSISPKRSSLDMSWRRSRDTPHLTHEETIQEARRKFEERERIKEEKWIREQHAKEAKEAAKLEKAQLKKSKSMGASGRTSHDFNSRSPGLTGRFSMRNSAEATRNTEIVFSASPYENTTPGAEPTTDADSDDGPPEPVGRVMTVKRRVHNAWTAFILWIRTRIFKACRR